MDSFTTSVFGALGESLLVSLFIATVFTLSLLVKSLRDFTRTGPQMP